LTLLSLSKIPFYADQRDDTFPLIIGGGPCAFNPEPLADFFDAFVIGDGEEAIVHIANEVIEFKKNGDGIKKTLLRQLSKIEGVYIPSFFTPHWNKSGDTSGDETGIQTLTPLYEDYTSVKRAFLPTLTLDTFPMDPIVPYAKPVHDRLRLEIARGCSRGCRFCQAGMIYRPVRERSVEDLLKIARFSLKSTGYSEMSLLSLSTGDYSNLAQLMQQLLAMNQGQCNSISLPSIRAERLTPELMELIKTVRKTGFTIAPEAGTQRLRDIINKNLTEASICTTVENALELGWKNIKLYFMMGLPFEEMEDMDGICRLSNRLAQYAKGKKGITVSVASFIPKAHTPFQRHSQIPLEQTNEKLQYLKDNLRNKRIKLKWQDPKMSLVEGVFARGDRRLSSLLVAAFKNGCRLDGWTDHFRFDLWQKAFDDTGIDPLFYTSRTRSDEEVLPWDHIDSGVTDAFLKKEFQRAMEKTSTPDCRDHDCSGCGVCDFERIQPVLHDIDTSPLSPLGPMGSSPTLLPDDAFFKFDVIFSKLDRARFFGHLELATIVERAVKRAGLVVKYSKGFNPSMKISFENALPLGMESERETLFIYLERGTRPDAVKQALNEALPTGLNVIDCHLHSKLRHLDTTESAYQIRFSAPCLDQEDLDRFLNLSEFMVEDLSKKGKIRRTDLRQSVQTITLVGLKTIEMVLKQYNTRTIRPTEVLAKYFKIDDAAIQTARIKKITQG
jgi:radical SAM family uncharacterized protein/radical SAM-linked protein